MNHQHDEEHANGHQVNGEQPTEEELDAYEEKLTNEAIIDQVKVAAPLSPCTDTTRHFSLRKKLVFPYTTTLKSKEIFYSSDSKSFPTAFGWRKSRFCDRQYYCLVNPVLQ
jgi:hypothetical protein